MTAPGVAPQAIMSGLPRHIIVGTAGHIDHGKTALVEALTGVNADRWEEERRRGITIDIGFAHLDCGPDLQLEFIDVPGHERFVRNMLAGAGGVDLALAGGSGGRVDHAADPRALRHLPAARHPVRRRRAHQIRPRRSRPARAGGAGGPRTRRGLLSGRRARDRRQRQDRRRVFPSYAPLWSRPPAARNARARINVSGCRSTAPSRSKVLALW